METTQNTNTTKMSAIERALAAAKARKAAKAASSSEEASEASETATAAPVRQPTLEERASKKAQRDEERLARKAASEEKLKALAEEKAKKKAEKAARKAEKTAASSNGAKPAHMKKVDRARSKLPALSEEAGRVFDEAVSNLSIQQIETLAGHLVVQARAMRTMAATRSVAPPLGSTVRITGGDPKFVGLTGEVVHSQKLRLLVKVEGVKKPVYLYTGEAEVFTPAAEESAAE